MKVQYSAPCISIRRRERVPRNRSSWGCCSLFSEQNCCRHSRTRVRESRYGVALPSKRNPSPRVPEPGFPELWNERLCGEKQTAAEWLSVCGCTKSWRPAPSSIVSSDICCKRFNIHHPLQQGTPQENLFLGLQPKLKRVSQKEKPSSITPKLSQISLFYHRTPRVLSRPHMELTSSPACSGP